MANNDEESKTKAVVFLGSGFSAALGLPTTAQLSEKLLGSSNTLRADPLEEFISGIICEFWKKVFGWSTGGRSPTLEDHFTQIDMAAYPGHHLGPEFSPRKLRAIRRMTIHRVFSLLKTGGFTADPVCKFFETLNRAFNTVRSEVAWDRLSLRSRGGRSERIGSFT